VVVIEASKMYPQVHIETSGATNLNDAHLSVTLPHLRPASPLDIPLCHFFIISKYSLLCHLAILPRCAQGEVYLFVLINSSFSFLTAVLLSYAPQLPLILVIGNPPHLQP
jgi:hypothetical protein